MHINISRRGLFLTGIFLLPAMAPALPRQEEPDRCRWEFEDSPAAMGQVDGVCTLHQSTGSSATQECVLNATCARKDGSPRRSTTTHCFWEVSLLANKDGVLEMEGEQTSVGPPCVALPAADVSSHPGRRR